MTVPIRINLLGGTKAVAMRPAEGPAAVSPGAMILGVAVFAALGLATFIYWISLRNEIKKLDDKIAELNRTKAQLADVQKKAEAYEAKNRLLKQRIDTVHDLENKAIGPVELMHAVGVEADRSNDLYLQAVNTQGERLAMRGLSTSVNSIANFLGTLSRHVSFNDVQLRDSYQDDLNKRFNYRFSLDCIFKASGSAGQEVPASQPGARPARPARKAAM